MMVTCKLGIAALCLVAIAARSTAAGGDPSRVVFLSQGWSPGLREQFYTTTQGSQMVPYQWFLALEDPTTQRPFVADGLRRFGYLPNPRSAGNPDGLPVGFVLDKSRRGLYLGLTCAACHTAQIEHAGTTLQIDGAPTGADLSALLTGLNAAIQKTNTDDATFDRFARKVLGARFTPASSGDLRVQLRTFAADWATYVTNSTPVHAFGPARTDAFGLIFNRVTSIDLDIPANSRLPDAPVSYPFLWDTPWHDRVQWDGAAQNDLVIQRLARNVGEVLGVFATVSLPAQHLIPPLFYRSSARRANLLRIEDWVAALRAPAWPEHILGPIDPAKKAKGAELYQQQHCDGCHEVVKPSGSDRHVHVKMIPLDEVGTDPTMARNNQERKADSGRLEGVAMPPWVGTPLVKDDFAFNIVKNVVIGAILELPSLLPDRLGARATNPSEARAIRQNLSNFLLPSGGDTTLKYRARPLDGIWATAPYLHNGSVPNLSEVLLPASRRTSRFSVGSRDFDPTNVGFVTTATPGGFEFDTSLPGNRNTGHEYGAGLSDDDRAALVEYLKSL